VRRHAVILVLAILVGIGGWLRLSGANWDDGGHLHPDERYLSIVSDNIRWPSSPLAYFDVGTSSLSPFNTQPGRSYVYGTLPLFGTKLAATVLGRDDYGRLNLVGRRLSALVDTVSIVLVYLTTLLVLEELGRGRARAGALLGAALYAGAVAAIQAAHFFTVDSWSVMLGLATFYLAARSLRAGVQPGSRRFSPLILLVGVGLGLTVACKLSGGFVAVPVLVALGGRAALTRSWASGREVAARVAVDIVTVGGAAYIAFRTAFPYAFASSNWLDLSVNHDYRAAVQSQQDALAGKFLYPPAYQWLLSPRIWDPLENLVVWQLGAPLGLVALGGVGVVGARLARSALAFFRGRPPTRTPAAVAALTTKLMLLAYVLAVFFYFGSLFAHAGRYLLPVVPFACIAAAYGLLALLGTRPRLLVATGGVVVAATFLYALAFHHIYAHENTRMAASDWIVTHVPAGQWIANEHWDDPLPVGGRAQRYRSVELPVFDADDGTKLSKLYDGLSVANYYVVSSPRAWRTIGRLPDRFPLMIRFYRELFAGRLGYRLAASFTSEPELLGVQLHDLGAEEAFWVYDHPPVMIFRRTRVLDADSFRRTLCPSPKPPGCP
jgi:Dolichyl-phosphate-mannose-protein mannosyltransferase